METIPTRLVSGPRWAAGSVVKSLLVIVRALIMDFTILTMKKICLPVVALMLIGLSLVSVTGCSRLLPARKGTASSVQMALDTRRVAVEQLAGTFIPGVFPAVTRIPVVFSAKIPAGAVFKTAKVDVASKNGEMKVLETTIEDNQVYLKFAVPAVDSFTQYNVVVTATYEYR